jgi:hypothetical protein
VVEDQEDDRQIIRDVLAYEITEPTASTRLQRWQKSGPISS